ncbi:hypothetical protein BTJ49_15185 [Oleiagrimonas sp. MCCC 1A03011]|nr:hypothetical protein BTJ49_15185 [Oleiagrimonas sp. MCCC 1A03011]
MKDHHRPFQLTSSQKWHVAGYGGAVAVAFFVLAMILGNTSINIDALAIIYLFIFGLVTGISLRLGTKRGWTYYAAKYQPDARYVFTKSLKLGVLWRVLAVWFAGRIVSTILLNQAESDFSLGVLLLVSIALVVVTALYVGLRYGWRSADNMLTNDDPAAAST